VLSHSLALSEDLLVKAEQSAYTIVKQTQQLVKEGYEQKQPKIKSDGTKQLVETL